MKGALHYLDIVKLHVANCDHDIYGCSDVSATTDQGIYSSPKATASIAHESIDYLLPPLLSLRLTPVSGHISLHSILVYTDPNDD